MDLGNSVLFSIVFRWGNGLSLSVTAGVMEHQEPTYKCYVGELVVPLEFRIYGLLVDMNSLMFLISLYRVFYMHICTTRKQVFSV